MTPAPLESATRPWVNSFANEMEQKLQANRHKGDRDGWASESIAWLFAELEHEVRELREALHLPCKQCGRRSPLAGAEKKVREAKVRSEAADVANFAMMIADVAGGLRP